MFPGKIWQVHQPLFRENENNDSKCLSLLLSLELNAVTSGGEHLFTNIWSEKHSKERNFRNIIIMNTLGNDERINI